MERAMEAITGKMVNTSACSSTTTTTTVWIDFTLYRFAAFIIMFPENYQTVVVTIHSRNNNNTTIAMLSVCVLRRRRSRRTWTVWVVFRLIFFLFPSRPPAQTRVFVRRSSCGSGRIIQQTHVEGPRIIYLSCLYRARRTIGMDAGR